MHGNLSDGRRRGISVNDLLNHPSTNISNGTNNENIPTSRHWRENASVQGTTTRNSRGPWRVEEDRLLTELVKQYGPCQWSTIAAYLPNRTGKQTRERWMNQLNPALKKKNWSAEEDRLILVLRSEIGNKWSTIASMLPGRTDNSVKNRFNSTLQRAIRHISAKSGTDKMSIEAVIHSVHGSGFYRSSNVTSNAYFK